MLMNTSSHVAVTHKLLFSSAEIMNINSEMLVMKIQLHAPFHPHKNVIIQTDFKHFPLFCHSRSHVSCCIALAVIMITLSIMAIERAG